MAFAHATTPAQIKRAQLAFLRELSTNVLRPMMEEVKAGKVPTEWDGIELRQWLADNFAEAAFTMHEKHNRRRLREYKNARVVNGLR